jgi:20S proteasome subunit alpha 7
MAGVGSGYDLTTTTFSPEGRVYQVEYATKAVEQSGTVIGIRCVDGVVLAVENLRGVKLLRPDSLRRIFAVDRHIGIAVAGIGPDGRHMVGRARSDKDPVYTLSSLTVADTNTGHMQTARVAPQCAQR